MGAKCAQPDRPALCFTGDGGIWYHLSELDTARRCGSNTVTVVNNNHSLNQERRGVERNHGGKSPGPDELWLFSDSDIARVAESMGCFGTAVYKPSELSSALDQAFASGRPGVDVNHPHRRHRAASVRAGQARRDGVIS
jgi:acetolactate synthase-1/2/3 large subunit